MESLRVFPIAVNWLNANAEDYLLLKRHVCSVLKIPDNPAKMKISCEDAAYPPGVIVDLWVIREDGSHWHGDLWNDGTIKDWKAAHVYHKQCEF